MSLASEARLEFTRNLLRLFKASKPFGSSGSGNGGVIRSRAILDSWAEPAPRDIEVREVRIGGVTAEWITADNVDAGRRLVYLHGGAYVSGSRKSHRAMVARIARASRVACLSVEYRLAPENVYPAALDDALAAVAYAANTGPWDERVAAQKLFVSGDSAGGGLALATMLAARDRNVARIDGAALISPWTDLAGTGESLVSRDEIDPMLSGKGLVGTAKIYLGDTDPRDPLVSPLYGDLRGLAPMLIHVGDHEILLDDSVRFAERARAAGVNIELKIYPELFHVFHAHASRLPEAQAAIEEIADWLRAQTA